MLHQVGAGVLGPVFRTHDPDDERLVAVKVFTLDLTPERAEVLAEELRRLASIDLGSRHVAVVVDAGVEESAPFLAMQYVAGESLDAAIRQYGPAPAADAARLIAHVAEALDAGARVGVFHGALHPRDVLVTPGETHLTGLGVASALEAAGARAPVRRPYAAPERESGGSWGAAADVFALGAMAHEVLTGRRALPGTEEPLPGLAELHVPNAASLRDVLESAMDPDPERRPGTAVEFATALVSALGLGPDSPADGQAMPSRSRRRRAKAAPKLPGIDEPLSIPDLEPVTVAAAAADPVDLTAADLDRVLDAGPESPAADATTDLGLDLSAIDVDRPLSESERPEPDLGIDDLSLSLTPGGLDAPRGGGSPDLDALTEDLERFELPEPERVAPAEPEPVAVDRPRLPDRSAADDLRAPGALVSEPPVPRALDPVSGSRPSPPSRRFEPYRPPPAPGRGWIVPAAAGLAVGLLAGLVGGYWWGARAGESRPEALPAAAVVQTPGPSASRPAPLQTDPPRPSPAQSPAPAPESAQAPVQAPSPAPAQPVPAEATVPPVPAPAAAARPATGRIRVRSTPAQADVFLDGSRQGVTPRDLGGLAFGSYTVRVTRPGYQPVEREVTLAAGAADVRVTVTLQRSARPPATAVPRPPAARPRAPAPVPAPVSGPGSIDIETRPPGARVRLDGRDAGVAPMLLADVAAGSHTVRLELDGYRPWTTTVTVKPGERARVTASLERSFPR